MERNKFRRLFLNYFLISWHLFAFMIIFLFFCGSFLHRLSSYGEKNQSLEKQTLRYSGGVLAERGAEEGWRMMNQFYKHFIVVAMLSESRKSHQLRFLPLSVSTWWMDEGERNLLCCRLFNHLLSHSVCNGWKSIM